MKSLTYGERFDRGDPRPRDLVDVARLALADLAVGRLPRAVATLLAEEPNLHDSLLRVRRAFSNPDAPGVEAFLVHLAASLAASTWRSREAKIRDTLIAAVMRALGECDFVDE